MHAVIDVLHSSPPRWQHYKTLLGSKTRLVSLVHVSNVLGAVLDTDFVVEEAKKVSVQRTHQNSILMQFHTHVASLKSHTFVTPLQVGARVLLDCCQSLPHMPVDVGSLGADWIVGSSHKMCGPTGIGFLWGRWDCVEQARPFGPTSRPILSD